MAANMRQFLSQGRWIIIVILIVAALLRLINITQADVISDEAHYAYRAIGYLDYMVSDNQQTPVDWFGRDNLPAWTKLSFHDHPPLVFLIQYIFFSLFGVSLFILRLPFLLAGLGSVWLVYLIGKNLNYLWHKNLEPDTTNNTGEKIGLLAALLIAVDPYHVWISRIGYLESIVMFFILLSFYCFLKSLENNKYFIYWGLFTGLAFITKYTAFFLIPLYIIYLFLNNRKIFSSKFFWSGVLIIIIIFSPVLTYNIKLYQTVGHFDMQLAAIFNQDTPAWPIINRSIQFSPSSVASNISQSLGWFYASLSLLALLFGIWRAIRHKDRRFFILSLALLLLIFQFSLIGSASRFLSLLTPWTALLMALALVTILQNYTRSNKTSRIITLIIIVIVTYQLGVAVNSHILIQPVLAQSFVYRPIQTADYGLRQLDRQVTSLIDDHNLKNSYYDESKRSIVIILDSNVNYFPRIWYFMRWVTYEAVPLVSTEEFEVLTADLGWDYFAQQNFYDFYFIKAEPGTYLVPDNIRYPQTQSLEQRLQSLNISPIKVIYNHRGQPAFSIYRFNIQPNPAK